MVLGGGGSRGSYEVGVWQALQRTRLPSRHRDGDERRRVKRRDGRTGQAGRNGRMWRMLTTDMVMDVNVKSDFKTMADQLEAHERVCARSH